MPLEDGDVPSSVARLISLEYDRACGIARLSQPSAKFQEGWGTPGSTLEGVFFRKAMLETLLDVDREARVLLSSYPPLKPHKTAEGHLKALEALINLQEPSCLQKYNVLIEQARHAANEPNEFEYEECDRLAKYIITVLRFVSESSQGAPTQTRFERSGGEGQ
ncbi:uncharacterized protein EI90DRAFT_3065764 [Cantharellus anzutake]|uniref:uncharacterized protein n=1 Tax=Cantharellus anzutake TaxID=1750568 RepID=UPI00190344CD|nr:uncharacterized protein EI90DRAFT_3065764 [Cantharellus anzutake]KAF8328158.1 hypothetical protein EI90DRAFT_3065764 [Cantharellus anzutake]